MRGHALESSSLSSPFLEWNLCSARQLRCRGRSIKIRQQHLHSPFPEYVQIDRSLFFFSLFPPLQPSFFSFLPLSTSSSPFFFSSYLFPPDPLSLSNLFSSSLIPPPVFLSPYFSFFLFFFLSVSPPSSFSGSSLPLQFVLLPPDSSPRFFFFLLYFFIFSSHYSFLASPLLLFSPFQFALPLPSLFSLSFLFFFFISFPPLSSPSVSFWLSLNQ